MRNDSYRISDPTIAMFEEDGRHLARFVPAGAIITIEDGDFNGHRLVNVIWEGTKLMMFAQDLRTRAEAAPENSE